MPAQDKSQSYRFIPYIFLVEVQLAKISLTVNGPMVTTLSGKYMYTGFAQVRNPTNIGIEHRTF